MQVPITLSFSNIGMLLLFFHFRNLGTITISMNIFYKIFKWLNISEISFISLNLNLRKMDCLVPAWIQETQKEAKNFSYLLDFTKI
jgi:hypothetical protein